MCVQAAEKVVGSSDWQAEPPCPTTVNQAVRGGGTGVFVWIVTMSPPLLSGFLCY